MGKSLPSTNRLLQELARIVSSSEGRQNANKLRSKPASEVRVTPRRRRQSPEKLNSGTSRVDPERFAARTEMSSSTSSSPSPWEGQNRRPLSAVVADCVKRWFHDTLKEAKAGDTSMQVLVGQMYNSGYGVPKNPAKGRAWISRASKSRSSVWRLCDKQPGYNASDSDSEEVKVDTK